MPRIKSFSPKLNLESYDTFITDTQQDSLYFRITQFNDVFTGGKNGFLIEGSEYLKESTDLQIEVLDVNADPVYHQPGKGIPEYYEGVSKLVSVHVYEDTPIGQGRITIFGELETYIDENGEEAPIPPEWQGTYNVKWTRTFTINQRLPNEDIVRFNRRPRINITELSGSLFSREIERNVISGSLRGIPFQPDEGTVLSQFPGSDFYKLQTTSGDDFNENVTRNGIVSVPQFNIEQEVAQLVSDSEIIVRTPYTEDGIVRSFPSSNFTLEHDQLVSSTESSVLASFAEFRIDRLSTFVGDVARLKISYRPAFSLSDYEALEDIRLESSNVLTTVSSGSLIPIGVFTQNYTDFWNVNAGTYNVTQSNQRVFGGLRIDGGSGQETPATIEIADPLSLSQDTEYTFEFDVQFTGDITDKELVDVYLEYTRTSGAVNRADIVKFRPTPILKNVQTISENVIVPEDNEYTLKIDVNGETWDLGKISFRAASETSFSPDDIQITLPITRDLEVETFDFKFEFYDINNNYIPVDVFASQTFRAGNVQVIDKSLTAEVVPPGFTFDVDDFASPENQTSTIRLKKRRLIGDVFEQDRRVYDFNGDLIPETAYSASASLAGRDTTYPGELTLVSSSQDRDVYTLDIANFTGSLHDNPIQPDSIIVSRIEYEFTEDPNDTIAPEDTIFSVYRIDDGNSSKILSTTADKNQFTYKRTNLVPAPTSQQITIDLNKLNLPVENVTSITKVGNGPDLTPQIPNPGTENETYVLTAGTGSGEYAYSDGTTRYTFSVVDRIGVPYSGSVLINTNVVDDAVNAKLTKDTHNFTAQSNGILVDPISSGDVIAKVQVGGDQIEYDATLAVNTWRIENFTISGGSATFTAQSPNINSALIELNSFPQINDQAVIEFDIVYKDGLGRIETIPRSINYSKSRRSAPSLTPILSPNNQSVDTYSTGEQVGTLEDAVLQIQEVYTGSASLLNITSVTASSAQISSPITTTISGQSATIELNGLTINQSANQAIVTISGSVIDSEGETRTFDDTSVLSKSKRGVPNVLVTAEPQAQVIAALENGTVVGSLEDVQLSAQEGGVSRFDSASVFSSSGFASAPTIAGNTVELSSATLVNETGTVVVEVTHTDSEGTTDTTFITISASKSVKGDPGEPGLGGVSINIVPPFQVVGTDANAVPNQPDDFQVVVREGGQLYNYETGTTSTGSFEIINVVSGSNNNDGSITPVAPTTINGSSVTFDVIYRTTDNDLSAPVPLDHEITVVLDGATGPGIVFTGEYDSTRIYQFTPTRRDAVLFNNIYYASLQDTQGNAPTGTETDNAFWESLGQQDFFVAAKIAIFEESFVQNTINIGTNNSGALSSANITLYGSGSNPYISIGQGNTLGAQGYATGDGIFIGRSGSLSVASFENTTSDSGLFWTGEQLQIAGALRQRTPSDPFEPDPLFRGAYNAGTTYVPGDIVTYTPNPIVFKEEQYILGGTPGVTTVTGLAPTDVTGSLNSPWEYFARAGNDAKSIRLSSDYQSFVISNTGSVISPSDQVISFTGSLQNINTGSVNWSAVDQDGNSVTLASTQGDVSNPPVTATLEYPDFSTNAVTVTAEIDGFFDSITVVKLVEGSDAITVVNSNPAHTVPATNDGVPTTFSNSGTTITVYEGATALDYTSFGPTSGQWTQSPTFSPVGSIGYVTYIDLGDSLRAPALSSFTASVDTAQATFNISGFRQNGTPFTTTTTSTYTKAKVGSVGPGVLYRGVFDPSEVYFRTDTRTDVVFYDDGDSGTNDYWELVTDTGLSGTSGSILGAPGSGNADWEQFGAQFDSVATQILVADQSYIQSVLNIGTNNNGEVAAANITLYGADEYPYFSLGQSSTVGLQGYNVGGGIFIGRDDADGEFKISAESGTSDNGLFWDGSLLNVSGSINAISGSLNELDIIGNLTFQSDGKLQMLSGSVETVRISPNEPIPSSGDVVQVYSENLTDVTGTVSGDNVILKTGITVPTSFQDIGLRITGSISATETANAGFDVGAHYIELYRVDTILNQTLVASTDTSQGGTLAANNSTATLDFDFTVPFAGDKEYRLLYRNTWPSTTSTDIVISNIVLSQYKPVTTINQNGIFTRYSPSSVLSLGGGFVAGSGGGSGTANWDSVLNKPFKTIGDNLEVASDALRVVDNPTFTGSITLAGDNYIKFGPGTPSNDDAHIEWGGTTNAGRLRISTSDDNGTEFIQFGDYDNPNRGGTFTEWLRMRRSGVDINGTLDVSGQLRVDSGGGLPSTTYTTTLANATAYFKRSNSGTRIFVGTESFDRSWIQPQNTNDALHSLLLNPVGGNVGIGITDVPDYKLEVGGTLGVTGDTTINGTLDVSGVTRLNNTDNFILDTSDPFLHIQDTADNGTAALYLTESGGDADEIVKYGFGLKYDGDNNRFDINRYDGSTTGNLAFRIGRSGGVSINENTDINGTLDVSGDITLGSNGDVANIEHSRTAYDFDGFSIQTTNEAGNQTTRIELTTGMAFGDSSESRMTFRNMTDYIFRDGDLNITDGSLQISGALDVSGIIDAASDIQVDGALDWYTRTQDQIRFFGGNGPTIYWMVKNDGTNDINFGVYDSTNAGFQLTLRESGLLEVPQGGIHAAGAVKTPKITLDDTSNGDIWLDFNTNNIVQFRNLNDGFWMTPKDGSELRIGPSSGTHEIDVTFNRFGKFTLSGQSGSEIEINGASIVDINSNVDIEGTLDVTNNGDGIFDVITDDITTDQVLGRFGTQAGWATAESGRRFSIELGRQGSTDRAIRLAYEAIGSFGQDPKFVVETNNIDLFAISGNSANFQVPLDINGTLDVTGDITSNGSIYTDLISGQTTSAQMSLIGLGLQIKRGNRSFDGEISEIYYNIGTDRRIGMYIGDDGEVRNYIDLFEGNSPNDQQIELGLNNSVAYRINQNGHYFGNYIGSNQPTSIYTLTNDYDFDGFRIATPNEAGNQTTRIELTTGMAFGDSSLSRMRFLNMNQYIFADGDVILSDGDLVVGDNRMYGDSDEFLRTKRNGWAYIGFRNSADQRQFYLGKTASENFVLGADQGGTFNVQPETTFDRDVTMERNLRVEGGLFAKEFVVNTTKVLTDFAMSAGGKIDTVTTNGIYEDVTFIDENGTKIEPFGVNDILHIQITTGVGSGAIVKNIWRFVKRIKSGSVYELAEGQDAQNFSWIRQDDVGQLETGDSVVRKGSFTGLSSRDHYIKFDISGNSGNAVPFVGVYDNVTDVEDAGDLNLAYGNLNGVYGVTTDEFGFAVGDASLTNNHIVLTPSTTKFKLDTFDLNAGDLNIQSDPSPKITIDDNNFDVVSISTDQTLDFTSNIISTIVNDTSTTTLPSYTSTKDYPSSTGEYSVSGGDVISFEITAASDFGTNEVNLIIFESTDGGSTFSSADDGYDRSREFSPTSDSYDLQVYVVPDDVTDVRFRLIHNTSGSFSAIFVQQFAARIVQTVTQVNKGGIGSIRSAGSYTALNKEGIVLQGTVMKFNDGILYVQNGELWWRSPNGTNTQIS